MANVTEAHSPSHFSAFSDDNNVFTIAHDANMNNQNDNTMNSQVESSNNSHSDVDQAAAAAGAGAGATEQSINNDTNINNDHAETQQQQNHEIQTHETQQPQQPQQEQHWFAARQTHFEIMYGRFSIHRPEWMYIPLRFRKSISIIWIMFIVIFINRIMLWLSRPSMLLNMPNTFTENGGGSHTRIQQRQPFMPQQNALHADQTRHAYEISTTDRISFFAGSGLVLVVSFLPLILGLINHWRQNRENASNR